MLLIFSKCEEQENAQRVLKYKKHHCRNDAFVFCELIGVRVQNLFTILPEMQSSISGDF
jgi:hypothetical protein